MCQCTQVYNKCVCHMPLGGLRYQFNTKMLSRHLTDKGSSAKNVIVVNNIPILERIHGQQMSHDYRADIKMKGKKLTWIHQNVSSPRTCRITVHPCIKEGNKYQIVMYFLKMVLFLP
jgi:hypothetical protein